MQTLEEKLVNLIDQTMDQQEKILLAIDENTELLNSLN
jgi:hypothetical protein